MTQPNLPAPDIEPRRFRQLQAGLLLLCLFLFFFRLGSVPIFDLDEALYVTGARQMAQSGDWITPRLNARPLDRPLQTAVAFYEKPALVYWLPAVSMRLFGLNEWAARLPAAFAALLATGAVLWAGTRWFGRRTGLLSGLLYALAPMTLLDARQMTTDGLLVLWLTVGLFAFFAAHRQAQSGERPGPVPFGLFWTACAFAILTKGAVGLLLPLLVIGPFLGLERLSVSLRRAGRLGRTLRLHGKLRPLAQISPSVRALRPVLGLLLCFALAAPWHLAIWRTGERDGMGRTWTQEYIGRQHIGRFKGTDKVHNAPLPTYFGFFMLGFFPWACFAPAAFRLGFSPHKAENLSTTEITEDTETIPEIFPSPSASTVSLSVSSVISVVKTETEAARFLLVWFWAIFAFFSLGAAKLPTYIVPAYPAAALLMARWLNRALETRAGTMARSLTRGAAGATVTAGLLLTAAMALPRFATPTAPISPGVVDAARHVTGLLFAGCLVAAFCFRRGERELRWRNMGLSALAAMMVLVIAVGATEGYDMARRDVLEPYQQMAAAARPDARQGIPIVYYHVVPRRPSMNYYAVDYSPLERKEEPLLPVLRPLLAASPLGVDVVTSRTVWEQTLQPEIVQTMHLTVRELAASGDGRSGWVLLRIETSAGAKALNK